MVTKVKCITEGCEMKDQVIPVTILYINSIAPLDGPYTCPKCGNSMRVESRVLESYKPGASGKVLPRKPVSTSKGTTFVGKKPAPDKVRFKVGGAGTAKGLKFEQKKPVRKIGPRKRGPSK